MAEQRPNAELAALLAEAELSPRQLASSVNAMFGAGSVSATAGYAWLGGTVPKAPTATRVAALLALRLGREVTAAQIWPGLAPSSAVIPASKGLDGPWERSIAVGAVTDWLTGGDLDRRRFVAVSGVTLMRAVWAWLEPLGTLPPGPGPFPGSGGSTLTDHIEASIPALQRLDDAYGGAAHLPYVEAQLRAVALVLREQRHPEQVVRRLLAASATLGQLCGWMSHDAGQPGAAQRHWFTALHAAREVGDRPLAAHIMADLCFQAASLASAAGRAPQGPAGARRADHAHDAVVLGEAACEIAVRSPATVRASVTSRLAAAYAAAGRREEFQAAAARAHDLLAARQDGAEPDWMYYLTPSHLACQAGYARIALGRRQLGHGDRSGRADVTEGINALRGGAFEVPAGDPSQRRALYEGAWLALGHASLADYDEALRLGESAAARLDTVDSPRSAEVLATLVSHLRPRHNNHLIREGLPGLERALGTARR